MAKRPPTHDRQVNRMRGISSAQRRDEDAHRAECPYRKRAARLRSSARWQAVRARQLRLHPLCCDCEARGLTVAATQVDHVESLVTLLKQWPEHLVSRRTPAGAFSLGNLQSLCSACHARKSAEERSR